MRRLWRESFLGDRLHANSDDPPIRMLTFLYSSPVVESKLYALTCLALEVNRWRHQQLKSQLNHSLMKLSS
mgnify:CR=1 FL=1